MCRNKIRIAIDGPAAAGKSTVAKMIAEKLSIVYVDTGAMYRALTLIALEQEVDLDNEQRLLQLLEKIEIVLKKEGMEQHVIVNGQDVTRAIRSTEVSNAVSSIAKHPLIRREMVDRQRKLAENVSVIMDGRDIGTNVLPNAEVKIFLIASVEERAHRRYEENRKKGFPSTLDSLIQDIKKRDERDTQRVNAPLKKAEDAIEIDTTSLTIEQVVEQILTVIQQRYAT